MYCISNPARLAPWFGVAEEIHTVVLDNGKVYSQTTVTENEVAVIAVTNETDYSTGQNVTNQRIKAVLKSLEGWKNLEKTVEKELSGVLLENSLQYMWVFGLLQWC